MMSQPHVAEVVRDDGTTFPAQLANLTTFSAFLKTDRPLNFREIVTLHLFELKLRASIAYVASEGARVIGAVAVFFVPQDVRRRLAEFTQMIEIVGLKDAQWEEHTNVEPDAIDENVDVADALFAPANVEDSLPDISVLDSETDHTAPIAHLEVPASDTTPFARITSQVSDDDTFPPIRRTAEPDVKPRPTPPPLVDRSVTAPPKPASAPKIPPTSASISSAPKPPVGISAGLGLGTEIPILDSGVNVRFASHEQFRSQHASNISHGGIIVRADPLPIGTQRFLALHIPGRDKYTVSARVTFAGNGTLGFAIDSFHTHKEPLRVFAES
jgi:hypothetical protein